MRRQWLVLWMVVFLISDFFMGPVYVQAGRLAQEDPVAQCAEGVKLFGAGQADKAGPLLEAGFAGRDTGEFANPDDLGMCALVLGLVRANAGNAKEKLAAYTFALEVFRASGNRQLEGTTLSNIGVVYEGQGRYTEALEALEQSLAICAGVGDRSARARR